MTLCFQVGVSTQIIPIYASPAIFTDGDVSPAVELHSILKSKHKVCHWWRAVEFTCKTSVSHETPDIRVLRELIFRKEKGWHLHSKTQYEQTCTGFSAVLT